MPASVSGYWLQLPQRSHFVHLPATTQLMAIHPVFTFTMSDQQFDDRHFHPSRKNAIFVFAIDSRFEHCTCLPRCDHDNQDRKSHFRFKSKDFRHLPQCGFQSTSIAEISRIRFRDHEPVSSCRSYQPHSDPEFKSFMYFVSADTFN